MTTRKVIDSFILALILAGFVINPAAMMGALIYVMCLYVMTYAAIGLALLLIRIFAPGPAIS